jgi:hypothetical protein
VIFQSTWGGATLRDMRIAILDSQSGQLIRVKGVVSGGYVGRARLSSSLIDMPSIAAITQDGNYLYIPHSVKSAYGFTMSYSGSVMKVNTANLDIEWYKYLSEPTANTNQLSSVTLLTREPNLLVSGCFRSTQLAQTPNAQCDIGILKMS